MKLSASVLWLMFVCGVSLYALSTVVVAFPEKERFQSTPPASASSAYLARATAVTAPAAAALAAVDPKAAAPAAPAAPAAVPDAPTASATSHQRRRRSHGGARASRTQQSAISHRPVSPATAPAKRYVFLDIAKQDFLKDPFVGRLIIELYALGSPKTVKNFTTLCHNKKYINTQFHRVIQGFMVQGGDIVNQDGSGVYSIYGGEGTTFEDESFALKHSEPGILSMANSGPNTNGSQFFITTHAAPHLDGKHCAFGKVVRGMEFIYDVEKELTDGNNRPIRRCYIMNSGLLTTKRTRRPSDGAVAEYEFEAVGKTTQSNGRAMSVAAGV